ncbi:Pimeloyl-ACP methyl ester carboxylesterase [Hymenobacter daecheongensis DSM 21074]|uniref:Pimeloyl-ACP methyl ester carboxylesterase n=1 Tax=Hymenobacter daecheongensis DSM 21074 TaxID=1121955 RepID=A0A1M6E915_9BACT|nr:alpha/beta hydrolase [Hymenobacter daecheongensis]SHI81778.1 Pimeloyl-ACP methyl ester carboxylesterase [Hymenobacter daecheongensis DSM 21074]
MLLRFQAALLLGLLLRLPALAQTLPSTSLNATLDGYEYPFPVQILSLKLEGQALRMAYMEVPTTAPANGHTVVLLHGKNFFGAYWRETIRVLTAAGFRVVVPDQIGFGKSDKADLHYSFHQLARNTKRLLDTLGVSKAIIVGHSMGGMLATRFALLYPEATEKLVLENPIGLEDYRVGVPFQSVDQAEAAERQTTEASLRKYHATYYPGGYPAAHDQWLLPLAAQTRSPDFGKVARANALTFDMIYQQPVSYEFGRLAVPTLLIIGQQDRTVVGKGLIKDPKTLAQLGLYPALGRRTAAQIKGAKLVELEKVGHIPHLEVPAEFHKALLGFLR